MPEKQIPTQPQESLTIILQQAKFQMIKATNDTMREYGIPAVMMDGILSCILADIRAQSALDVTNEAKVMAAELSVLRSNNKFNEMKELMNDE